MLKKVIFFSISIFFLVSSCKITKVEKGLVTLNISLKGIPLEENGFLMGASTLHSFSNQQVPTSIHLKLPKGVYHLGSKFFYNYFYLSKDESPILDKGGRIHLIYHALGDLKSLENKTFQEILQRWNEKFYGISLQELWEVNKEITAELTHLLLDPQLDKEFVRIQKKDLEYAEKNAAKACLYGYEQEWDYESDSYIYKKKFTPAQRKKLEDFIKTSNLNDEELFINGYHYRKFLESYINHKEKGFLDMLDFIDKSFKSQMIKDYFLFNEILLEASRNLSSKDHVKNYKVYQRKAKNPHFKSYIKSLYKKIYLKGDQSPDFSYEDIHGKKLKLSQLKGNYVYIYFFHRGGVIIDSKEISYLKKLVKKYEGKPIQFVGIFRNSFKEDKDNWKKRIKEEKLDQISIQLIADKKPYFDFMKYFNPLGDNYPVFLDKQGKVIKRRAPKFSSSNEMEELLKGLK